MIPRIDAAALLNETHPDHADAMQTVQRAAHEIGFMVRGLGRYLVWPMNWVFHAVRRLSAT